MDKTTEQNFPCPSDCSKTTAQIFCDLFDCLTKTLEIYESHKTRETANILLTHLEKFKRTYELSACNPDVCPTFPKNFLAYFREVFEENQDEILRGHDHTEWLTEKGVVIQYGKELIADRSKSKKVRDIKIHLSAIYNTSIRLKDDMEEKLKSASAEEYSKHIELIFPDIIRLHLYRIFAKAVVDPEKVKRLVEIEMSIKKEIGKEDPNVEEAKYGDEKARARAEKIKSIPGSALGGAGGMAGEDIRKAMGRFFAMPGISSTITGMMEKAKTATNPTELIGEFIGKITSKEFAQEMEKARDGEGPADVSIEDGLKKALGPVMAEKEMNDILGSVGSLVDKAVVGASAIDSSKPPAEILTEMATKIAATDMPKKE